MLRVRHFFTISETFSITDISIKHMHTRCGTRKNCEAVVQDNNAIRKGGERLSDLRDFPVREMDFVSAMGVATGNKAQKLLAGTRDTGFHLGMRKRILFAASVEPAGEPAMYPKNVGRWRRVVAPFAIKRAGVPRNRALTNLTNSHHGGI